MNRFEVIVIGGGHAGVEAAWTAANLLPVEPDGPPRVALITSDPRTIGVMSCNPAIGGLAKGQLVREIDALGGLMGLAADATGIQFKVLNTSRGLAVHGPRAQCDKHAYAEEVQRLIRERAEIRVVGGMVEEIIIEAGQARGVRITSPTGERVELLAPAVILTTGTFMRGLMHTGESQLPGGRHGEPPAVGISGWLRRAGFELGRLKTGTPPRLARSSIRWDELPAQQGDDPPRPFSELSRRGGFPRLAQVECRQTRTTRAIHELIRANLHRAPMYSGQIESVGPRYCPSIEDKVVRFADRDEHGVFLEPESLRDDWIYCNGISTSLPADVQEAIVRAMPGCESARILRMGYAVEYDMVRPHQIDATGQARAIPGLFLAGQINGTSGYEEAAAQGLVAGLNAARLSLGREPVVFGRAQAYIGVLMDDLVTRTPVEPYRMFTSRAEHRLVLRSDNAPERLTPVAIELGLLSGTEAGRSRRAAYAERERAMARGNELVDRVRDGGLTLREAIRRPEFELEDFRGWLSRADAGELARLEQAGVVEAIFSERTYEPYLARQRAEIARQAELEHRRLPDADFHALTALRAEARQALVRFRPRTFGQASRLEGITPADLGLLAVLLSRRGSGAA